LGPDVNVVAFISKLGANLQPKNAQSRPQGFLALTPSVERALKYFVNFINCENLGKTKGNYLKYAQESHCIKTCLFCSVFADMLTEPKRPVGRHFKKQNAQCPSFGRAAPIYFGKKIKN
jgi:hypothetical protein